MIGTDEVTRDRAIEMCDEPCPDGLELRPYQPGPEFEERARVLVRLVSADQMVGLLVVPKTAQRPTGECIVIDVGKGAWSPDDQCYVPFQNIHVGDRILIGRYVGTPVEINHEVPMEGVTASGEPRMKRVKREFTSMKVEDIMCIFEPVE